MNSSQNKTVFNITRIAENPIKSNFVAFITMDKKNADLLSDYKGVKSIINEAHRFEELRALGWTLNDMPHWDMRRWDTPGENSFFCCYFELPEEIARGPQPEKIKWLTTLLELKSGRKIAFEIKPGSLNFRPFLVDPHRVENPICPEGLYPFPIAICGDALMSAEYRKGTGISNGVLTANGLINAISVEQRHYRIDSEIFDYTMTEGRNTRACIQMHQQELKDFYQQRRDRLANTKIQVDKVDKYLEAHSRLPQDEVIKKGLLHQIGELKKLADAMLSKKRYQEAIFVYEKTYEACQSLEKNSSSDQLQLILFFNLKSRICSNLERAYGRQEKVENASYYLGESSQACFQALELLSYQPENESLHAIIEGLKKLQQSISERKDKYNPSDTSQLSNN